jgi:hypothetical protein
LGWTARPFATSGITLHFNLHRCDTDLTLKSGALRVLRQPIDGGEIGSFDFNEGSEG